MEEGSLLQDALEYMGRLREGNSNGDGLQNTLQIDIYDLAVSNDGVSNGEQNSQRSSLQRLAELAVELNSLFKESTYPWMMGGDGVVFGIHVNDDDGNVPRLRAICRYGLNVADEWKCVQILMESSRDKSNIAILCWDLDDGPFLLIECAEHLPGWLEDNQELDARHVCWIVGGKLTLVRPAAQTAMTLRQAVKLLKARYSSDLVSSPINMQRHLQQHLNQLFSNSSQSSHRTAVLLPRSIAWMLHRRPDLIPCLANEFENYSHTHSQPTTQYEDWVWYSISLPRTQYAMLRTLVTPTWRSETYIPPCYKTAELKRLVRVCQREATPHLKHAWQIGVRLTAGVDYVVGEQYRHKSESGIRDNNNSAGVPSITQQRVLQGWTQVDRASGGDGQWLLEAWQAGPNRAQVDLSPFLQCPVFESELQDTKSVPCPLSHPQETLRQQVKSELRRKHTKKEEVMEASLFVMPRAEDVHSDDWLNNGDSQMKTEANTSVSEETRPVDSMLEGFKGFMGAESDFEGVSHDQPNNSKRLQSESQPSNPSQEKDLGEPVRINPRVFLNMLQNVLKSSPEDVSTMLQERDPFFSEADYTLMEADKSSDDDHNDTTLDAMGEMKTLMDAMDEELRHKPGTSRNYNEGDDHIPNDAVAEDAHVLSNLLESLDASGGASGPVRNILQEMGHTALRISPEEMMDDGEESSQHGDS